MTKYHFSLGNSSDGPVGFCAEVEAESQEDALEILKEELPESMGIETTHESIVYLRVYFNPNAITTADIDDEYET